MLQRFKKYIYRLLDLVPAPAAKILGIGFSEEAGFRRYFFNTSWLFFGQLCSMVASFFVGAYVARYLGPKNYGLLNFIISFTGLFGFLAGFGIDAILNRELVKRPEDKEKLIGSAFWIKFVGGLMVIIIANIAALSLRNEPFTRLLVLLFSFTYLVQSFGVISLYFQSQVMAEKNTKAQLAVLGMAIILKLLIIYFHKGVAWFVGELIFEASANAAILLAFYYYHNNVIRWRVDAQVVKNLLKDAMPLMFITVAMSIYLKIDQTLLKFMVDEKAVGLYAVAVKLSEIWYFIPNLIIASLFPALVNAKSTNERMYYKRLGGLYRIMIVLSFCIALPLFIFAPVIINYLFGSSYSDSVLPFRIYIWSGIPIFLMAAVTQYLIIENFTYIYLTGSFIGAAVNILLNLLLIPRYNIVGSALATLIAYFIPIVITFFYARSRKQWNLILYNEYNQRNS